MNAPFIIRPRRLSTSSQAGLGVSRVLFQLLNADMNSTSDQAFEKIGSFTKWAVTGNGSINVELVSGACSSAVGGIYTAASKGGQDILIATQAYSSLTLVGGAVQFTVSKAGGRTMTDSNLFLSLTTAHGSAGRCNFWIVGVPLS